MRRSARAWEQDLALGFPGAPLEGKGPEPAARECLQYRRRLIAAFDLDEDRRIVRLEAPFVPTNVSPPSAFPPTDALYQVECCKPCGRQTAAFRSATRTLRLSAGSMRNDSWTDARSTSRSNSIWIADSTGWLSPCGETVSTFGCAQVVKSAENATSPLWP